MKRNNTGMLLLGITLLLIGSGFLAAQIFHFNIFHLFRGWWTLFLIVPAVSSMIETKPNTGNVIVLSLGLVLLAYSRGWLDRVSPAIVLSAAMVLLGVWLVLRALGIGHPGAGETDWMNDGRSFSWDDKGNPAYSAVFGCKRVRNNCQNLLGGSCAAILGTACVDFSEAFVTHDITLICNAILGSTQIIAPRGCRLVCKNLPLLGTVHCSYTGEPSDSLLPVVTLDCTAVLGSVEIL